MSCQCFRSVLPLPLFFPIFFILVMLFCLYAFAVLIITKCSWVAVTKFKVLSKHWKRKKKKKERKKEKKQFLGYCNHVHAGPSQRALYVKSACIHVACLIYNFLCFSKWLDCWELQWRICLCVLASAGTSSWDCTLEQFIHRAWFYFISICNFSSLHSSFFLLITSGSS